MAKKIFKIICLFIPLLLVVALILPYGILNSKLLVDILGCGCPVLDEDGNPVRRDFNANDFSALFWTCVWICSFFLSLHFAFKTIPKGKTWQKCVYILANALCTAWIAHWAYINMLWC